MIRHEYLVTRRGYRPSGRSIPSDLDVRPPTTEDRLDLATLMMEAYVGTIDYDGETYDQAVEEVDGAFASETLLAQSRVAVGDGVMHSAVLVNLVEGDAFIGYTMTRADAKNQGLASALLDLSMEAIWTAGYEQVRCFITEGNKPSERIFYRAGFRVVGTIGAPKPLPRVNPLEELRAEWPEAVALLEDVIASDFLRTPGGGAGVREGVLEIEVYDKTVAEDARSRWPDAIVTVVSVPTYQPLIRRRDDSTELK